MVQIASQSSGAARLALCERSTLPGAVDGAWWPSNSDLRTQLPDLVAVLGLVVGPVHRVVYDPSMWPHAPSRIIRGTAVISVDPYAMVSRDTIYLIGTHARNAVLYVVPPSTHSDAALRILRAVSDGSQPMSVPVLRTLIRQSATAAGASEAR